jgi:hypothetical protein
MTRAALRACKTCGRRVAGLGQHSAGLQRAHSGLPQYGVVQQLWAGSTVRRVATVRLQHNTSAMDHLTCTVAVPSDATTRRHTADRVQ